MFFKIVFLKKFANFTGKHLCRSLFNKFAGPQLQLYWKETLVKSAKFLRTPYFTEHLQWLLSIVSGFQPATLLKKRFRQKCFSVNLAKFLRTSFDRSTSGWLLLKFICEFWEVFQNISFIEHLWETAYFMYKLQYFNQQIQWRTISQVLFKHCIQEHEK